MNKEDYVLINKIFERAERMGIYAKWQGSKWCVVLDIENTHKQHDLRLQEWLDSSPLDFSHDYGGIVNNFNRETLTLENHFCPRFANK